MPANTSRVLNITSGANHTVILLEAGNEMQIWGSGDGSSGQLGAAYHQLCQSGAPSTIFRFIELPLQKEGLSEYKPKLVSASWETTYIAFSRDGGRDVLISMGANDFGDLGVGVKGKAKETVPFHVVSFDHLELHGTPLKNANISILSLATGQHHVIAQLEVAWNDKLTRQYVVGWGASRHGQLGSVLDARERPIPYVSTPRIIPVEDLGDPIIATALGNQHTVLLHASGRGSSFGSNRKGQIQGLGDVQNAVMVGTTWNGTYVVTNEGDEAHRILTTGSGAHGQLGRQLAPGEEPSLAPVELPLSKDTRISKIACGTEHVIVLLSQSSGAPEVWGWGWNEHGNLGIGTTENAFAPVQLWTPTPAQGDDVDPEVVGVWGGSGTSWIVTKYTR
ncbi:hypothetical protein H0H87_006952 [Tephrocybe sp. NHM501043]|nr:hypothetical protein H0H87_006952 [Tephrocybe sp. NHM501043]